MRRHKTGGVNMIFQPLQPKDGLDAFKTFQTFDNDMRLTRIAYEEKLKT